MIISENKRRLNNIKKKATANLLKEHFDKLHFLEPENFHLFLEQIKSKKQ